MDFTQQPFKHGDNLTHEELNTAFKNITGHAFTQFPGIGAREAAAFLGRRYKLAFEWQVNRVRGFALDLLPDGSVV